MFDIIYELLKSALQVPHAAHIPILLWLDQLNQRGEDHVTYDHGIYIGFNPVEWTQLPNKIQRAELQFDVHLVDATAYGDEQDVSRNTIGHYVIQSELYVALANKRFLLSAHGDFTHLAGTDADQVMIESIVRTRQSLHNKIGNLVDTVQTYKCTIFDYSAAPVWQQILATLNLDLAYEQG